MTTFLLIVIAFLVALLAGQVWIMTLMIKRYQHLEGELTKAHLITSLDRQRIQTLKMHLDDTHLSLEAILEKNSKEVQNMSAALEMVLGE